jgi:general secretion pathway protein F
MESLLGTLVALLGPLMIVAMGAVVLLIVIAMLMPIIQLNDLIGR